jgi:arginase
MGPSALRIAGLGERLSALGLKVVDEGDIRGPTPETSDPGEAAKKYIRDIAIVCEGLYERSLAVLAGGGFPIVLGGDHSLGAGSVAAVSRFVQDRGQRLGLLWIDAHGDMNTPGSSASGNVHGMPLAALLGQPPEELASLGGFSPKVSPEDTALIGLRNLDEHEKAIVRNSGVHVFTMKDIDRLGIASVTERAIELVTRRTAGIHVSFDMDVCDPAIAPGVGTPVRGGFDYREAHMVMEMLADSQSVLAIDIVEINPVLDVRNATAILGTELVLSALGMKIL